MNDILYLIKKRAIPKRWKRNGGIKKAESGGIKILKKEKKNKEKAENKKRNEAE